MTERKDVQTAPCDGGGARHQWSGLVYVHYHNGGQYTNHVCKCRVCGVHGLHFKRQTTAFDASRYASELGRAVLAKDADLRDRAREDRARDLDNAFVGHEAISWGYGS